MADLIDTSAIKNITEYPNSFKRQGMFPLERYSLFNSYSDAVTYATTNPIAYVGQPLVVTDFSDWAFSDEGTHTIAWDSEAEKWVLDASTEGEIKVSGEADALSVTFSESVTATRSRTVKSYVIGVDSSLIEMGTKADISAASQDASGAVAALDVNSTAIATKSGKAVTINAVKQTDGLIAVDTGTAATKVTLADVASTGKAEDVEIDDTGDRITATTVEGALGEIAAKIDAMSISSTAIATKTGNAVTIHAVAEDDGVVSVDTTTTANQITLADVASTGAAADVAVAADATSGITAGTVQGTLQDLKSALTAGAVTMTTDSSPSDGSLLKVYTLWAGGSNTGTKIGDINIPKDLVVTEGSVVDITFSNNKLWDGTTDVTSIIKGTGTPTSDDAGKYIKLVVANQANPLYIAAKDLVDIYTAQASAAEVQVAISGSNVISASIVAVDGSKINLTNASSGTVTAQAAFAAMNATTTASTASEDTSAIQGISVVTGVTQVDGVVSMTTAKADKYGSASKAKADVIGTSSDEASADTINGAKAYADSKLEALTSSSDVPVATVSDGVVTLTAGIAQDDGVIEKGSGSDITLAKVATTGAATDVSITDSTGVITATTVEGALQEIATEIDGMDLASTAIATKTGDVVTINAIKEVDGKVSVDTTANTITLEEVASTGAAADVSIADAGSVITATTVEGALQEIAAEIDNMDVASFPLATKDSGTNVITIKGLKETDGKVSGDTSSNTLDLAAVAATGAAADISIADAGGLLDAATVEAALQEVAGKSNTAVQSVTGETALSGATANNDFVSVSSSTSNNAVTLSSKVKVQAVSSASSSAQGLAEASDVKTELAKKNGYLGTATAAISTATITTASGEKTAIAGDTCTYSGVEYIWNGSAWVKLNGVAVTFAGTALTGSNNSLSISKSDALSALNVADGAEVNVIVGVKVGATSLTPDSNRVVTIDNLILDGGSATSVIS